MIIGCRHETIHKLFTIHLKQKSYTILFHPSTTAKWFGLNSNSMFCSYNEWLTRTTHNIPFVVLFQTHNHIIDPFELKLDCVCVWACVPCHINSTVYDKMCSINRLFNELQFTIFSCVYEFCECLCVHFKLKRLNEWKWQIFTSIQLCYRLQYV